MERSKKYQVVEDLGTKLKNIDSMFLAEYLGMNVAQVTRLRRELRAIGVEFSVVKNTLLKIASAGTKAELIQDKFQGPNAIICIYNDPASAAKVIQGLSKDMPQLKMKGGVLGTRVLAPEDIMYLASLPSREVLIAKFMGLLQSVPQRFMNVLSGNVSKLLYTLDAIKNQKAQA